MKAWRPALGSPASKLNGHRLSHEFLSFFDSFVFRELSVCRVDLLARPLRARVVDLEMTLTLAMRREDRIEALLHLAYALRKG